jgi:hypothetical protein
MGQIGPIGVAGQAIPRPRHTKAAPPFSPTLFAGGVRVPPSPYIKAPQGEEENTPRPRVGSSPPSSMRLSPLSLYLSFPCGSLKDCVGTKVNSTGARRRAAGNLASNPNRATSAISVGSEIRRSSSFIVCVRVLWGAALCGTKSLRLATSRSTRPWGRLRWLHHQRFCGSVFSVFGLQGYVTESELIVTTLLIDRSWAFGFSVAIIFLFLAMIPNINVIESYLQPML